MRRQRSITLPPWLGERLEQSAAENARSVSSEMVSRLAESYGCDAVGGRLPLPVPIEDLRHA